MDRHSLSELYEGGLPSSEISNQKIKRFTNIVTEPYSVLLKKNLDFLLLKHRRSAVGNSNQIPQPDDFHQSYPNETYSLSNYFTFYNFKATYALGWSEIEICKNQKEL
jgi:hypothetical protein